MTLFLVLAQAPNLPPPPAPQANHSVSPFSVLLVVVIVLGSVAMIALSSRKFRRAPEETPARPGADAPARIDSESSISTPAGEPVPVEAPLGRAGNQPPVDPSLLVRLRRAAGAKSPERRKLGDRKTESRLVAARERRFELKGSTDRPASEPKARLQERAPVYPDPIPIRRGAPEHRPDEAVIAPPPASERNARRWSAGPTAPEPAGDELVQLEARRFTARVPLASSRLRAETGAANADPDDILVGALSATIRELLSCANSGDVLRGFSLYSDALLFRTMDDLGLGESEFQELFLDQRAKPRWEWTELAEIRDLQRFGPDLVSAIAVYSASPDQSTIASERFRFILDPNGERWLIDDIEPLVPVEASNSVR